MTGLLLFAFLAWWSGSLYAQTEAPTLAWISSTAGFWTWFVMTVLALIFSRSADEAASRSTQGLHQPTPWIPITTTILFSGLIGVMYGYATIPLLLAGTIVSPVLFLPPLTYRIFHHTTHPAGTVTESSLFTFQECSRIREKAWLSKLVRDFMKRYPTAKAYVYRTDSQYNCGGLLLHNREQLPIAQNTCIEVALDCPFTSKAGVLAESREQFCAYLGRHNETGSTVVPLPQSEWGEWIKGMKSREWMEHIEAMEASEVTHPPLGSKPVHLVTKYSSWEKFALD